MKILLIDDDDFLREMYTERLRDCGFAVTTANGSTSTLSLLDGGEVFDLMLLDMVMPGTSGIELLEIINSSFPSSVKKVIFLTNQGQKEDIVEVKNSGAAGFIIKTNTAPSEIAEEIKVILGQDK